MIWSSRCQRCENKGLDDIWFLVLSFYGTSATFANLKKSLHTLAEQYWKPLHVVETDYPAICNGQYNPIPTSSEPEIPHNVQAQTTWVDDVIVIMKGVPRGLGRGSIIGNRLG
jgi:arabinogalactan endo-1,4-beta-galactosidase